MLWRALVPRGGPRATQDPCLLWRSSQGDRRVKVCTEEKFQVSQVMSLLPAGGSFPRAGGSLGRDVSMRIC
jgi:hypothetical protein